MQQTHQAIAIHVKSSGQRYILADATTDTPIYTIKRHAFAPHLRIESHTSNSQICSFTRHIHTSRTDMELHGRKIEITTARVFSRWSFDSPALQGKQLTWHTNGRDGECKDADGVVLARLVAEKKSWRKTEDARVELVVPMAQSGSLMDEIALTGLLIAHVGLSTKKVVGMA